MKKRSMASTKAACGLTVNNKNQNLFLWHVTCHNLMYKSTETSLNENEGGKGKILCYNCTKGLKCKEKVKHPLSRLLKF